ncbi:MAG TPA: alkaline phosphatase D family protein [Bacteroidia bacterium]|jgi:alkaline phosphatase D
MRYLFLLIFFSISQMLLSQNEVIYIWSGAVTHTSAKVNAKMSNASSSIRLVVDDDSTFASPLYSPYYSVSSASNLMVSMEINGLNSLTTYFYAVESGGVIDASSSDIGRFKTFASGPFSYSFVVGSCALSSSHKVFDVIRSMSPAFFLSMGDLHYEDPNSGSNINVHRLPYENSVLSKAPAAKLFKEVPFAYMWDDHDFCGNNSDSTYAGKANARKAYHEYVPHYPLALGTGPNFPIAQAFTVGRIHFILTDLRSQRSSSSAMPPSQRTWFENECLYARDNNLVIAWLSTYSWSGTGSDNWSEFSTERKSINDFLFCNQIENLFILSGDAHMLGIDNGSNSNFSSNTCGFYPYPNFQAAALNQNGSYKGGVYSEGGYFMNPNASFGQFGLVDVLDSGSDSICISLKGYRVDVTGTTITVMNSYNFCRQLLATAVEEGVEKQDILSVRPNPSNSLSIGFTDKIFLRSVKIYSILGNLLFAENINAYTSDYSPSLSQLTTACYIVEVETDKQVIRTYWIKK